VTIQLWTCDGKLCLDGDGWPCGNQVTLEPAVNFSLVDVREDRIQPSDCIIQFHLVPAGKYTVTLVGRAECGPACDAGYICKIEASDNHIAIEPLGFENCPVHVIS
jgi:hypothetical protein